MNRFDSKQNLVWIITVEMMVQGILRIKCHKFYFLFVARKINLWRSKWKRQHFILV